MIQFIELFCPRLAPRLASASALYLLAFAASLPACSSDPGRPSLISVGGNPADAGSSGSSPAESGSRDFAGAGGDATGDSGATGENGGASAGGSGNSTASGGSAPVVPAACNPKAMWGDAASVAGLSSAALDTLLAITPDELDLALLREGALYVAHRSSPGATCTIGSPLAIPAGWTAAHGAALSADGKRLLLVSDPDQKMLGELTRSNRSAALSGPIDTSAFTAVNLDSIYTGKVYASPTLSADDDQLLFNSSFLETDSTIVVSSRAGSSVWSTPKELSAGTFDGSGGKRRLPTGMSADGRTLFYFNEESAQEEARWRATSSVESPLYDMLSLGARRGAAPNSACNRIYSESNGDVVVEKD